MKFRSWFLLMLSGFLYALPFINPLYCWWCSFIFPIPLFYVATQETLGFGIGLFWAYVSFLTHLSGVLKGIDANYTALDAGWTRFIPIFAIPLCPAIYGALFFGFTSLLQKYLQPKTNDAIIALWTITLWIYLYALENLIFWPFNCVEGVFLFHPILPLAVHPQLLLLIPYIGKTTLELLMVIVPATISLFIIEPSKKHALFMVIALLPWIVTLLLPAPQSQKPSWLEKVVALPKTMPLEMAIDLQAKNTQQNLKSAIEQFPQAELIIMPESSYYNVHLSIDHQWCALWNEKYIGKPVSVILGAFRWDGPEFRNSLHWFYNGQFIHAFDKRHAMVLLERIPPILSCSLFENLFFKYFPQIQPSPLPRPRYDILPNASFVPYICSELLFKEQIDDPHHPISILATTNDKWCFNLYVSELMYLGARLKAIQWQRNILYISFKYAVYFDTYGNEIPVNKISQ